jgi:hypothetical protein
MDAPAALLEMQKWFAEMIALPLRSDSKLPDLTPHGKNIAMDAKKYIHPTPQLQPHQRLEIYHQQYWWRLVDILQDHFPMLTRMFGYEEFNQKCAVLYLIYAQPLHYNLCYLGNTLGQWIKGHYEGEDKNFVLSCAEIDWAINQAFWTGALPPIRNENPEKILNEILVLQPHIKLFALHADFFSFRELFLLHDVEHYYSNPFPELHLGENHYIVYRNCDNIVSWKKLSRGSYSFFCLLEQGYTIYQACEKMEEMDASIAQEAENSLHSWIFEGINNAWLSIKKGN